MFSFLFLNLELVITQGDDQVIMTLISQIIKGILRFLKNYLRVLMVLLLQHPLYYQQQGFSGCF